MNSTYEYENFQVLNLYNKYHYIMTFYKKFYTLNQKNISVLNNYSKNRFLLIKLLNYLLFTIIENDSLNITFFFSKNCTFINIIDDLNSIEQMYNEKFKNIENILFKQK